MYMEIKQNNIDKVYELMEDKKDTYKTNALMAMVAELLMHVSELKNEIKNIRKENK